MTFGVNVFRECPRVSHQRKWAVARVRSVLAFAQRQFGISHPKPSGQVLLSGLLSFVAVESCFDFVDPQTTFAFQKYDIRNAFSIGL
jgi:hypothetical protein